MSHVFVRLSGNGLRLLPYWPYRFARSAAGVKVACWNAPDIREVVVDGASVSGASVEGIVDVEDGPDGEWRIETTAFSCAWPEDFTIESPSDPGDATKFYLFGPGQEMIFPQGPAERVPEPQGWAGPGQTVKAVYTVGRIQVVELKYKHGGTPWWQSHWLVPFRSGRTLVITAQAPVTEADRAKRAATELAVSVRGAR
jgi:hypothetical protein